MIFPSQPRKINPHSDNSIKRTLVEIKADLYSILQTAGFIRNRFETGSIDSLFYYQKMKKFHSDVVSLQNELSYQQKTLLDILDNFSVDGDFRTILSVVSSIQDFQFNQMAQNWQLDPYLLASVATECTSNFITLIDYLHLIEAFDQDFLSLLISELEESLGKIHTFQPFSIQIKFIKDSIPNLINTSGINQINDIQQIRTVLSHIEQEIYSLFQEFKQYLNLH